MNNSLILNSLTKKYGSFCAVNNLSLTINPGIHAFLGPNGAGKSTTLLLILGLLKRNNGDVIYQDKKLDRSRNSSTLFHKIGFLPENGGFYPNLSGIENLTVFFRLKGIKKKLIIQKQATELLTWVKLPKQFWKKKTKTYSHGMKQRLALARAFIGNPQLIILDEPFQNLDPLGRDDIIHLIKDRYQKDSIIIFTTHETYEAEQLASDIVIFNTGEITLSGNLNQIASSNNSTKFVLDISKNSVLESSLLDFLENQSPLITNIDNEGEGKITLKTKDPKAVNKLLRENDFDYDFRPELGTLGKIYRDVINGGKIDE